MGYAKVSEYLLTRSSSTRHSFGVMMPFPSFRVSQAGVLEASLPGSYDVKYLTRLLVTVTISKNHVVVLFNDRSLYDMEQSFHEQDEGL